MIIQIEMKDLMTILMVSYHFGAIGIQKVQDMIGVSPNVVEAMYKEWKKHTIYSNEEKR